MLKTCPIPAALLLCGALFAAPQTGTIVFLLRDHGTGLSVHGTVAAFRAGCRVAEVGSDERGRVEFVVPPGTLDFLVQARGFARLATRFAVACRETLNARIELDPALGCAGPAKRTLSPFPAATARFCGFVTEPASGRPVAGVTVRAGGSGAAAVSDASGYFSLDCPANAADAGKPPAVRLLFTKANFQSVTKETWLLPGECRIKIGMEKRPGAVLYEKVHGLFNDRNLRPGLPSGENAPGSLNKTAAGSAAPFLQPPGSIRVGTGCPSGRTSCTAVEVMSLESYVGSGLDDEWIASWNAHSLKAGAVAFRSYGAYFADHPAVPGSYDICASTACQIWQSDQYASVVSAAAATAGIMLDKGGSVAFAEYSAENNNAGCGDGWAGNGTLWPCNRDAVCAGQAKSGHGRGMCQWGSQRWAANNGKVWTWIVDHYYRIGGDAISSPVKIASVSAAPSSIPAGGRFVITASCSNGSNLPLGPVIFCASLSTTSTTLRDTVRDSIVTAAAGAGTLSRSFLLPADAAAGPYDLTVWLWLDANGDRLPTPADTGGDLLLARYTQAKALEISGAGIAAGEKRAPETMAFRGSRCLAGGSRFAVPPEALARDGAVVIIDARGGAVRRLGPADVNGGFLVWDGRDNGGNRAPGSVYFLIVNHAGGNRAQALRLVKLP